MVEGLRFSNLKGRGLVQVEEGKMDLARRVKLVGLATILLACVASTGLAVDNSAFEFDVPITNDSVVQEIKRAPGPPDVVTVSYFDATIADQTFPVTQGQGGNTYFGTIQVKGQRVPCASTLWLFQRTFPTPTGDRIAGIPSLALGHGAAAVPGAYMTTTVFLMTHGETPASAGGGRWQRRQQADFYSKELYDGDPGLVTQEYFPTKDAAHGKPVADINLADPGAVELGPERARNALVWVDSPFQAWKGTGEIGAGRSVLGDLDHLIFRAFTGQHIKVNLQLDALNYTDCSPQGGGTIDTLFWLVNWGAIWDMIVGADFVDTRARVSPQLIPLTPPPPKPDHLVDAPLLRNIRDVDWFGVLIR